MDAGGSNKKEVLREAGPKEIRVVINEDNGLHLGDCEVQRLARVYPQVDGCLGILRWKFEQRGGLFGRFQYYNGIADATSFGRVNGRLAIHFANVYVDPDRTFLEIGIQDDDAQIVVSLTMITSSFTRCSFVFFPSAHYVW